MPHPALALARLRGLTGLAAAVVPAAILVHLVAEASSLGHAALGLDFVLRHLYLAALFAGSLWAFGRTMGVGCGRAEIRRRTALLRASIARQPLSLPALAAGNLVFFALTQAGEGLPILSGTLWAGLAAGVLGSFLAALIVRAFGRSVLLAALELIEHAERRARRLVHRLRVTQAAPRTARAVYSLFAPNRPPPHAPSSDPFLLQKGTSCFLFIIARRASLPRFSPASFFS